MDANHETNSELEVEQDSRPRGRGLLTACVIVLFLGVIGLGVAYAQLHRAHERTLAELGSTEDDLRQSESRSYQLTRDLDEESSRLRTCRDELDGISSRLASAMSTIRGVESSLGLSRNRNNDLAGQVDGLASRSMIWPRDTPRVRRRFEWLETMPRPGTVRRFAWPVNSTSVLMPQTTGIAGQSNWPTNSMSAWVSPMTVSSA